MFRVPLFQRQGLLGPTLTAALSVAMLTLALTPATAQRSVVFVHGILSDAKDFDTMQPWIQKVR